MDLNQDFIQLQDQYKANVYPCVQQRKENLSAIKKVLQDNAYSLAQAVSKDYGHRSQEETLFLEIYPTIKAIDYVCKHLKKWMCRRKRKVSWQLLPAYACLMPQPLGVVGIITPWNYPIFLSLVPAVYALAAGNRVMIKMSELTPNIGKVVSDLVHAACLSEHVHVVNGDVEVSKQFAALPFQHLLFTGSTQIGKQVMKAASEHLTPVTLELGGKSPAVLSKTMNKKFFSRLFMGKMFNAGQTCIAPDYLLVPTQWEEGIEQECNQFLKKHYPKLNSNMNYTNIISKKHKQRILDLVKDAQDKGARIVSFGSFKETSSKLPLYLIFNVTVEMKVLQEEVFGPILPVLTYTTFKEAIDFINSGSNPLAVYYFGEDKQEQQSLQVNTLSGALLINDTVVHAGIDDLPFGGVGASGMGQYHGQEGFDTFSKLKPIMVQRRFSPLFLMYPPYGKLLQFILHSLGGIKPPKNKRL